MLSKARITAIGAYVPERVLSNADLEKMVDTSDDWIVSRTGMRERRIADKDEYTTDLCLAAVENLQQQWSKDVSDVDFIIVSTTTPDFPFPSVASQIQSHFGIRQTGAIDMNATCAGFTHALHMANALVTTGLHRKVLVLGAETLSKVTDYSDRGTCILFGDGAGAVLVETDEERSGFLQFHMGTEGEGGIHLYRTGLSSTLNGQALHGEGTMFQNGREVYKWAVKTVPAGVKRLLEKGGLEMSDIDWFVPHSANLRMIESICERVGFPLEKTLHSLEYYGNTSSATIPLAIHKAVQEGKIEGGDKLLLYGFGGGLVHAGLIVEWNAAK